MKIKKIKEEFFVDILQKEILVITIGESWTYGDSLDEAERRLQIYGKLIANSFDADYINIARCGASNSWIINQAKNLSNWIDFDSYKKVYIIFTFTEAGRDFEEKKDWLVDYSTYYSNYIDNLTPDFYNRIISDTENIWSTELNKFANSLPKNVVAVLGQNFAWHEGFYKFSYNKQVIKLEKNWLETIADQLKLAQPPKAQLVTGWIFQVLHGVNNILDITDTSSYKEWTLYKLDEALLVNEWLDQSPVNYKKHSKHPNSLGHQIWANYIIDRISF